MRISDESSGREVKGAPSARSQAIFMLYASFHTIMTRRSRVKQKRNALHLMTLSGVIRPGHIELRYGTQTPSFHSSGQRSTLPAPPPFWNRDTQLGEKEVRRGMRTTLQAVMELTRKPFGPQWNTD